ncbi:MAG TPA: sigma-54 dependent transcriptional regulator [Gemmatimonadales bacterium]|nr:sigma-54 dependent transcriptional regulator [Gemmatimonadales bacterium]
MSDSVLLIDEDAEERRALGEHFEGVGYEVGSCGTGEAGLGAFDRLRPDVVVLDRQLPDMGALAVLEHLRSRGGSIILLASPGDIETTARALELGAEHVFTKPVDLRQLTAATARVCEKVRVVRENARLRARDHERGASPAAGELGRQIQQLAASERSAVLLMGEHGTGKGRVACVIHHQSPRADGPFVEVSCAGRSVASLDSALFGHEPGAFAEAKERRLGLLELADRGTLFLDEIGELAPELQPKVLKVLEHGEFRRMGGTRDISVDVRLVAATSCDLPAGDLHDHLSAMSLRLPAVRERSREDRLALLTRLLADLAPQMPGCPTECSADALDRLVSASWPGNVREMRNVVERAMIAARGTGQLGVEHLPVDLLQVGGGGRGGEGGDGRHHPQALAEVARVHIEKTLRFHGGNRTRAAEELGISRATLINKIKSYGLDL